MNINLERTKEWYAENDRLEEFYKKYVCSECRYCIVCAGRNDSYRIDCVNYKAGYPVRGYSVDSRSPIHPWGEMSYNRIAEYGSRTQQERIRFESFKEDKEE